MCDPVCCDDCGEPIFDEDILCEDCREDSDEDPVLFSASIEGPRLEEKDFKELEAKYAAAKAEYLAKHPELNGKLPYEE